MKSVIFIHMLMVASYRIVATAALWQSDRKTQREREGIKPATHWLQGELLPPSPWSKSILFFVIWILNLVSFLHKIMYVSLISITAVNTFYSQDRSYTFITFHKVAIMMWNGSSPPSRTISLCTIQSFYVSFLQQQLKANLGNAH